MTRRAPLALIVLRAVACWGIGYLALTMFPGIERLAMRATAIMLDLGLNLVLPDVERIGDQLGALGVSFQVEPDCTPLGPIVLLWGTILATPAPGRSKLMAMGAGGILLWMYNLARIAVLMVVLARMPEAFDLAHVYLWQTMTIVVILGSFLLWVRTLAPLPAR